MTNIAQGRDHHHRCRYSGGPTCCWTGRRSLGWAGDLKPQTGRWMSPAVSSSPALSTPTPTLTWMWPNTTTADDFCTGSRAALRGGTTTVIDFACPNKGESLHHGLDLWHQKADGQDFLRLRLPHDHRRLERVHPGRSCRTCSPQGISSFKMYLTYPAMMIGDRDIYWALKELRRPGRHRRLPLRERRCHRRHDRRAEGRRRALPRLPSPDPSRLPGGRGRQPSAAYRPGGGLPGGDRPPHQPGGPQGGGARPPPGPEGRMWRTCPSTCCWMSTCTLTRTTPPPPGMSALRPCGPRPSRTACGRALRRGAIQTVSTDHCSFTLAQKDMGREDFTKIPGGLPGVETRGELLYSYGVAKRRITAARDVPAASARTPPGCMSLYPPQGRAPPRRRRGHRRLRPRRSAM